MTDRCELCGKETEKLSRHHLIPRAVKQRIGDYDPRWREASIQLCRRCHGSVHECFIDHLAHREKGEFSRLDALKYVCLKEFLEVKYPEILQQWRNIFKGLVIEEGTKITHKKEL